MRLVIFAGPFSRWRGEFAWRVAWRNWNTWRIRKTMAGSRVEQRRRMCQRSPCERFFLAPLFPVSPRLHAFILYLVQRSCWLAVARRYVRSTVSGSIPPWNLSRRPSLLLPGLFLSCSIYRVILFFIRPRLMKWFLTNFTAKTKSLWFAAIASRFIRVHLLIRGNLDNAISFKCFFAFYLSGTNEAGIFLRFFVAPTRKAH